MFNIDTTKQQLLQQLSELELEDAVPSPFQTKQQQLQACAHQWADVLQQQTDEFANAFSIVTEYKAQLPEDQLQQINDFFEKLSQFQITSDPISWTQQKEKNPGYLFQTVFSSSYFETFYKISSLLLTEQKWSEARAVLMLLSCFAPGQAKVWLALGSVQQQLGDLHPAILAYSQASRLSPSHPLPTLLCAECHLSLGLLDQARENLDFSRELMKQDSYWNSYQSKLTKLDEELTRLRMRRLG